MPGAIPPVDDEAFEDEDRAVNPKGAPEWPEGPKPPVVTPEGDPCLECGDLVPGANPNDDVEPINRQPDIYVYPPSPDGIPLKASPAKLERHTLVDEAVNSEGFVIVEPSGTKRDSSDKQYGFEFVDAS